MLLTSIFYSLFVYLFIILPECFIKIKHSNILIYLNISEKVKTIGSYSFSGCSSVKGILKIPDSVTFIGNGSFSHCTQINFIDISKGLTEIPSVVQICQE